MLNLFPKRKTWGSWSFSSTMASVYTETIAYVSPFKKKDLRLGKTDSVVKSTTILPKDLSLVPSIHMVALNYPIRGSLIPSSDIQRYQS